MLLLRLGNLLPSFSFLRDVSIDLIREVVASSKVTPDETQEKEFGDVWHCDHSGSRGWCLFDLDTGEKALSSWRQW